MRSPGMAAALPGDSQPNKKPARKHSSSTLHVGFSALLVVTEEVKKRVVATAGQHHRHALHPALALVGTFLRLLC